MLPSSRVRPMRPDDLPTVLSIQSHCYVDIEPESEGSMRAKLLASPRTCFVAEVDRTVCAYLLALPWLFDSPPLLNAPDCTLPAQPDTLYLHDLAVSPQARGTGAATRLIEAFFTALATQGLPRASLVAIQRSAPFWQRHGFEVVAATPALGAKLASYGEGVHYMHHARPGTTPRPAPEREALQAST